MCILRILFGNKNAQGRTDYDKPGLDKLLYSDNKNSSIIEMDNFICKLCHWGENLEKLTEPQKNFFFIQNLEREVNNGGFKQYFYNSSGDFSHETIKSLKIIGADKTAAKLQEAIDQFPDKTVPKDRAKRHSIMDIIGEKAEQIWDELDQRFFVYEDDLNSLNIEYIRQNKDKF